MVTGSSQWERPTEPAFTKGYECAHILVKHAGSRRPSSWRSDNITRSREDARNILVHQADQRIGQSLCHFPTTRQGVQRLQLDQEQWRPWDVWTSPNAEAIRGGLLRLDVGEMSDVVDTDSGLRIIWRIAQVIQKLFTPHSDFLYCISMFV